MPIAQQKFSRRTFLTTSLAGAGTLAMPNIIRAQSREIKIGYITALSGPRADFGVSDEWTVSQMKALLKDGLKLEGGNYSVEIVVKDNQSNVNRSASVGQELILRENVDLMLIQDGDAAIATGELADLNELPSVSTIVPWQAWMFSRGSTPDKGFPWTFAFFWGADDAMSTFVRLWDTIDTNKIVGDFYLDNSAGLAFSDPKHGLPALMAADGYERVDGGLFKLETDDFSTQVSKFKAADVDIVTGFCFPPHWTTFWNQAGQAGFQPEACTIAAAFLFPAAIEALGDRGDGMTTEVWWTPRMPFTSSLNGQSAEELATAWERDSGKQWVQTLGYSHALFEVGIGALKAAGDPRDRSAVRDAIASMDLETMVGPVNFKTSPIKSVAVTQLAGGQWRRSSGKYNYDLLITENALAPSVSIDAQTVPLSKLS